MDPSLAPIAIFTYKRKETLNKTIGALLKAPLADKSTVYIFSDGPKTAGDSPFVNDVRDYIATIKGFKTITCFFSETNKGLAPSIISGVSNILRTHRWVIVLEDDLVVSPNFLCYMNAALSHYEMNPLVFSVAGFTMPMSGLNDNAVYFTQRASSWGWATWKDRWDKIDWEIKDYSVFKNDRQAQKKFNKMGSDMTGMLKKQMDKKINSWAIRWCYHQFRSNLYTVVPAKSKVVNIGFSDPGATHTTEKFNRFKTTLDDSGTISFDFSDDVKLDKRFVKQFTRPYGLLQRIRYKIINTLFF